MLHRLKIDHERLLNLTSGKKKVEIRCNDRDYQRDDVLQFFDYSGSKGIEHRFRITHIHSGLGMDFNYVALSVSEIEGEWSQDV